MLADAKSIFFGATAIAGLLVAGRLASSGPDLVSGAALVALALASGAWALLEKRDRDARRRCDQKNGTNPIEQDSDELRAARVAADLVRRDTIIVEDQPLLVGMVDPLSNADEHEAKARRQSDRLGADPANAYDGHAGDQHALPPLVQSRRRHAPPSRKGA